MCGIGEKIIKKIIEDNGKISIAFCPYLREMFGCMQSVYDAAVRANLDTDVFYIPWGKKGYRFPDIVIPRQEYIVLHNPFDHCNRITTVHPAFYSYNLKNQGKKIIYIPYHTGRSLEHEIMLPVVRNADYIFCVDSEDARAFLRAYPEKRIYGYGSPKKDLIKRTQTEKKILCASLMPVLDNPRKIELYRAILENGVVFRPHPLTERGLEEIKPDFLPEWRKFVESVKIDTEKDLEKSLNGYGYLFTDSPSIAELWKETEKPYEWIYDTCL